MPKERDEFSKKQLELNFDFSETSVFEQPQLPSNVVYIRASAQRADHRGSEERALIEQILESAQRLKW
jgi:hypothetical protein